jgi:hypothetical protein
MMYRRAKFLIPYAIRSPLKSAFRYFAYGALRIVGNVLFPIFGVRMPLRGYCANAEVVCTRFGGQYIRLDPAHAVHVASRPPSRDDLTHLTDLSFTTPDTFVGTIPRGQVVHNYGIALSPDHKLLADISPPMAGHPTTHPVLFEPLMPPVRKLRSHVAVVTSQAHQRYFHWLFDILPRFDLIRRSKMHVDHYVVNSELSFQKESLDILGIPTEQIISPQWATHIEAQTLILPSLPGKLGVMTPRSCEFLRATFLPIRHQKPIAERLIYITRRNALTRRVLNEQELLDRMSRYEFEAVELENTSIARQAELFANALLILAPHGAGLANVVFCSKNSALIEFMPDTYNNPCFEILAGLGSLRYICIPSRSVSPITHDQYVDVVKVMEKVEQVLASNAAR